MSEHYFTPKPGSRQNTSKFTAVIAGHEFVFTSDAGVFSKTKVDLGSRLLIEAFVNAGYTGGARCAGGAGDAGSAGSVGCADGAGDGISTGGARCADDAGDGISTSGARCADGKKVLDWGCGYGPIGVVLSYLISPYGGSVLMTDINERAVQLARLNATDNVPAAGVVEVRLSDGFNAVPECDFDIIVSNPPIRAGKQVVYGLVEDAIGHLKPDGRLIMVARTSQGAKSLARKMEEVFGSVEELEKGSGYRVIESVKRGLNASHSA